MEAAAEAVFRRVAKRVVAYFDKKGHYQTDQRLFLPAQAPIQ